jgi:hypothetical protein
MTERDKKNLKRKLFFERTHAVVRWVVVALDATTKYTQQQSANTYTQKKQMLSM